MLHNQCQRTVAEIDGVLSALLSTGFSSITTDCSMRETKAIRVTYGLSHRADEFGAKSRTRVSWSLNVVLLTTPQRAAEGGA